jgi:hypothetical protein
MVRPEEGTPEDDPGWELTSWLEAWKEWEDKMQAPARFWAEIGECYGDVMAEKAVVKAYVRP